MTFSRKWLDTDGQYLAYKHFVEFKNQLVTWDTGPTVNNGRALASNDGETWSVLFSALGADFGNFNVNDGCGMAVYNGRLYVSLARSNNTDPKVLEYDSATGVATGLLTNPSGNYWALDMAVWNNRLWVVTDITPYVSNRRVVYHYNGSIWTAITDYDGASYLDYNRADSFIPSLRALHRATRLFVFNNELYLVATRWDGTQWAWEVWKFDAAAYDNFTLLFDSSTFADNFVLSSIVDDDGTARLVGNEILLTQLPTSIAKLYTSTDMTNWTEVSTFSVFEDEFDDASRGAEWTDEPNAGTITETAGILTLAVGAGVNGDFWGATKNAPIATIDISETEVVIVAKLNSYTVNTCTRTGIYVTDSVSGNNGIHFGRYRTAVANGIEVLNMGVGSLATVAVTTLPIWLRIRISGSGAGSVMKFDYSTDGKIWNNIHTQNNESWSMAGLAAWNWNCPGYNAISAPFEFFHVYHSPGFPYGEETFIGRHYLNCIDANNDSTLIRHWDGATDRFVLDQEITTNSNIRGGALKAYPSSSLYAGKYMEIYAEAHEEAADTLIRQLRRKKFSIPLLKMTFVDKLDNELVKYYAPIDARADERFWEGRIKSLSSLRRALDDRTGLYKVADMSVVLANNDMEFSKLLYTYELKNQEAVLYHQWTLEPESDRMHVLTMIVEDHSLRGTEFTVKFKDATQKYFTKRVPEEICTEDEFPQIHPDSAGKPMPEILGLAYLGADFEHPGAVKAIYTNTTFFRYLAAAGTLNAVTQVYSNDVLQATPAQYSIVYLGGRTFIDFVGDQGDNTVSFNAQGYSFGAWDSVNGYVQNPAYIVYYYMRYIMGMDAAMLDGASFDALAETFESLGLELAGKLILQDNQEGMEVLRQLLFTYGIKGYVAMDGKFRVGIKDISDFEPESLNAHIFDQVDLIGHLDKQWNLTKAVNTIKVRFNYIPWQRLFAGAVEEYQDNDMPIMDDDIRIPKPPWEI